MGRLGTRLAKLEAMTTPPAPITIEIWVPTDEDGYRNTQSGDTLTGAEFRHLHPDAFTIRIDRASVPALLEEDDA